VLQGTELEQSWNRAGTEPSRVNQEADGLTEKSRGFTGTLDAGVLGSGDDSFVFVRAGCPHVGNHFRPGLVHC
jgi:hypothetical protein